jgi:PBSX family phage portal protein
MAEDNNKQSFHRPAGKPLKSRRAAPDSQHVKAMKAYSDRKQFEDPFIGLYTGLTATNRQLLAPPYNLNSLIRLPKENNILRACIDAKVTNVVGHGYGLTYIGPDGEEESPAAKAEAIAIKSLLDFPNEAQSLIDSLTNMKTDKETIGVGYLEVGRDDNGKIALITHIPGHTMRRTIRDEELTSYDVILPRDGTLVTISARKRFCRYAQRVNGQTIFFKEFGDPRSIDPQTGEVRALPIEQQATEIIADGYYNPGDAYGLPCWIGQMPSILGSRESELANLDFFKENTIPALAVLVSGGTITQASMDQLEQVLTAVRGRASLNRVVFVEAEADTRTASSDGVLGAPKLDIKPLAGERQNEGLFLEYDKDCRDKIRNAFKLPPLFVGATGDYTFASAKASFEVAESQVFGPERRLTDDMVNSKLLASHKPQFWAFRLQPPRISDPEEVTNALATFDTMGAMTPNTSIQMANEYFDLNIPKIKEPWGNWPFAIVQAYANAGRLKGVEEIAEAAVDPSVDQGAQNDGAPPSEDPSQANQPNANKTDILSTIPNTVYGQLRRDLEKLHRVIKKMNT